MAETNPLDSMVERNRSGRFAVMVIIVALILLTGTILGGYLGQHLTGVDLLSHIGTIAGAAAGAVTVLANFEKWFVVRNPTTGMFVTQNVLSSLLGRSDVNVAYGPGVHLAYPWERRLEENNISLEEAAQNFEFTVQCSDGTLKGKGSYRLRPDMNAPIPFLTGVAAVANEISDFFIADIVAQTSGQKMQSAMRSLGTLNQRLSKFRGSQNQPHEIERRFGVEITDVTVSELLPSEEVQKTMSALSEARAVRQGTAILLGMSLAEVQRRLQANLLSPAEFNLARDRFLSISGNLEGMNINRTEFDLSVHGLSAEALKELRELAQTPAAQAAAAAFSQKRKK